MKTYTSGLTLSINAAKHGWSRPIASTTLQSSPGLGLRKVGSGSCSGISMIPLCLPFFVSSSVSLSPATTTSGLHTSPAGAETCL